MREQGVSPEDEYDGRDAQSLHLIALDERRSVVGTCRLLPAGDDVKLSRMAVAAARRGEGIAAALLAAAEGEARALSARRIVLAAQLTAARVYERAGYSICSQAFMDAGIEHVWMERALA